ncbi:MAG: homoserine dehydrogenase [Chloroflexi bacterium]|nr:homoserine dehydrogenase [Chloroflexota bacterium]
MKAPLRVAVLGAGTVGAEVVRAILERPESLLAVDGAPIRLAGVAVRDVARAVARGIPETLLTDAPAHLVADPETDVVVELMGGDEPARTLIAAALAAGKGVVTANKHVLAHHGAVLEAIARGTGAALRFEAAVGGGIPVLGPLALDLAANRIEAVRGIVNGTTNLILSRMAGEGRSYADVLAEAQRAGFAEADPRDDVEGDDAANKLVVLARLAFGRWLDVHAIGRTPGRSARRGSAADEAAGRPGITGVTLEDVAAATARGFVLKLIAAAVRRGGDGMIDASVLPTAVAADAALARTNGVLNRIEIEASPLGTVAFAGPGAGGAATASAVLGDLIAIARGAGSTWAGLAPAADGRPMDPAAGVAGAGVAGAGVAGASVAGSVETFDAPSGTAYPVLR